MKRFNSNDRGGNKRRFNKKFDNRKKGRRPYRGPWWMQKENIATDPSKVDMDRVLASFDHRTVKVRPGENAERAIKRFNKLIEMAGVMSEMKKREFYRSPSEKIRDKKLKAEKRLRKKVQASLKRKPRRQP